MQSWTGSICWHLVSPLSSARRLTMTVQCCTMPARTGQQAVEHSQTFSEVSTKKSTLSTLIKASLAAPTTARHQRNRILNREHILLLSANKLTPDTWVSPCRGCVSDCHLAMQVARRWTSCTPSALRVAYGPPSRAERCCPHGHLGTRCAASAASLPLAARRASSDPLRYAHIPASPQHAPTTGMQHRALAAFCEASQGCLLLHS